MLVNIKRTKIDKKPENKVTSPLIYEPHRRQSINRLKLHKDGIFSREIFGNFYKCNCEENPIFYNDPILNKNGDEDVVICPNCGCRVLDPNKNYDFYIDLETNVPVFLCDYDSLLVLSRNNKLKQFKRRYNSDDFEGIMNYERFILVKNYSENNDENINFEIEIFDGEKDYDSEINNEKDKVLIGIDALKFLGVPDNWINENTVDYISIPHVSFRPLIAENMQTPFISPINNLYSKIISKINKAIEIGTFAKNRPLYLISQYNIIVKLHNEIIKSLFDDIQEIKYNIIKSEIISHPISGAIRAVMTNRHDLNEDILLIGDTLVETLWPYLYEKHKGNMIKINEELVESNALVLINRPPTICHLSIMAMRPRISSIYPFGKTSETNGGLLHNYKYCIENENLLNIVDDTGLLGDVELYAAAENNDIDNDIDNVGVRILAMNPIAFDGMGMDTDGDQALVIALYSNKAKKEAELMLPSKLYKNYANGTIRNHIIEDFIFIDEDNGED